MKALDLIKRGWCQRAYARDRLGNWTSIYSKKAVAWDAYGALLRVSRDQEALRNAYRSLCIYLGIQGGLNLWNDDPNRTHEEVIAAFEAAKL